MEYHGSYFHNIKNNPIPLVLNTPELSNSVKIPTKPWFLAGCFILGGWDYDTCFCLTRVHLSKLQHFENPTVMDDLEVPPILGNLHILLREWRRCEVFRYKHMLFISDDLT